MASLSFRSAAIAAIVLVLAACTGGTTTRVQGYAEGEYVYVASPIGGELKELLVSRGTHVAAGTPLFKLDEVEEKAVFDEAKRKLDQSQSTLDDLRKGKRPTEIAALEAQLKQTRASLAFSVKEFERQGRLMQHPGSTSEVDYERARSARDTDAQRVAQAEADLATAQLGSREDQITAAEANVRAAEAALRQAEWQLDQKRQNADEAGLVFDTYYRPGEWVAAGKPVVALLPPSHIKVRAFVPEMIVGRIHPGDAVRVFVDGVDAPFDGKVSYISPHAEYTPPVIYSNESRNKLVFLVEALFEPATAEKLHPGQPVDVEFKS
jgi:HlyD family secretion protein